MLSGVARLLPASIEGGLRRASARRRDVTRAAEFAIAYSVDAMETPPCALCGGMDVKYHLEFNGFRIVKCSRDGLIFVSPRPRDVTPFYDSRYFTGQITGLYGEYSVHAREMQAEWSERLAAIDSLTAHKGLLVDVGAATGEFLVLARKDGWAVAGIEKSEWASQKARDEHALEMTAGDLAAAAIPDRSIDVITIWDCIEHVSNPADTLAEAARVIKPGGIVAISTGAVPDGDPRLHSGWYFPPWHLYYFSPQTLKLLCRAAGFSTVSLTVKDSDTNYAMMTLFARRDHWTPASDRI